jgi:predicted DNA-binding transcriptional regulator
LEDVKLDISFPYERVYLVEYRNYIKGRGDGFGDTLSEQIVAQEIRIPKEIDLKIKISDLKLSVHVKNFLKRILERDEFNLTKGTLDMIYSEIHMRNKNTFLKEVLKQYNEELVPEFDHSKGDIKLFWNLINRI